MKTVVLLAPTGMLGSMVYNVLKDRYRLVLVYRDAKKLEALEAAYGGTAAHTHILFDVMDFAKDYGAGMPFAAQGEHTRRFLTVAGSADAVINCLGITKPYSTKDPFATLCINGGLPHLLSQWFGSRFIHITSDCVYDGRSGAPYTETSPFSPVDLYGLSKRLGEPSDQSLVLRTSIIGPEIANFALLISWFLKQEGKTIQGFTNHLWNGITTRAFGEACDRIISSREEFPSHGLFHIFSTEVSKFHMLEVFKEKYGTAVTIEPVESSPIDRRLGSDHDLCSRLQIPSFEDMMRAL